MIIGLGMNLTEREFTGLMKDYYLAEDEDESREIANEIMGFLDPLIDQVTAKFDVTDLDDLKQFCRVKLMLSLDKWKPEKVAAIEGFFRQVCVNAARDYPKKRTEREFKALASYDSEENSYIIDNHEGTLSGDDLERFEVGEEVFLDIYENVRYNEIYQVCLTMLIENVSIGDSVSSVVRQLEREYPEESSWRLKNILQNAKITLREHYFTRTPVLDIGSCLTEMDDSQTFKRLSKYLTEEQLRAILAVFSGCEIRVPSVGGN